MSVMATESGGTRSSSSSCASSSTRSTSRSDTDELVDASRRRRAGWPLTALPGCRRAARRRASASGWLAVREALRDAAARQQLRRAAARRGRSTTLNEQSSEAALGLRFDAEGAAPGHAPAAASIRRSPSLLAIVHESMRDGTWLRLKACPADDCRWAFYDHSRNRSGTWCDMGGVRQPRQGARLPRAPPPESRAIACQPAEMTMARDQPALGRRDRQGGRELPRLRAADPGARRSTGSAGSRPRRRGSTPSSASSTPTSPSGSPPPATRSPPASTTTSSRSTSSRPARAPRRT